MNRLLDLLFFPVFATLLLVGFPAAFIACWPRRYDGPRAAANVNRLDEGLLTMEQRPGCPWLLEGED